MLVDRPGDSDIRYCLNERASREYSQLYTCATNTHQNDALGNTFKIESVLELNDFLKINNDARCL